MLTPRWTKLKYHEVQQLLWKSKARFTVVPAGRRSGKTEIAKRKLVKRAIEFTAAADGRFIFSAPTHAQAKEIFWDDAKKLVPDFALAGSKRESISESNRTIYLWNGGKIQVIGMDKPERIEGSPIDGIVLDEYANMKAHVWTNHVRPGLSTIGRPGWAMFIGVPEGRNHYYVLYYECKDGQKEDWEAFTWTTASINPEEAEEAKKDMDLLTYLQEYEGDFISFEGRAYYSFLEERNVTPAGQTLRYQPYKDLIFCFDFNRKPGVAVILQEQKSPEWLNAINGRDIGMITAVIGEVYIENNSNTEVVCQKLRDDWGLIHEGRILVYGDASGGANTSSNVKGSDWDLVMNSLRCTWPMVFKKVPKANPSIRARINAVNSHCFAADGQIRMILNRATCPKLIRDLEGVAVADDGTIEKSKDLMLTHISDALGYYIQKEFPCKSGYGTQITGI